MIERALLRFTEFATGKRLYSRMAQLTGLSERGLRKGLPKGLRPSTEARMQQAGREFLSGLLRKQELGEEYIQRWLDNHPKTIAAALVYEAELPGEVEYPQTRALAQAMDALGRELYAARLEGNLERAKGVLLETEWLDARYYQADEVERNSDHVPALMAQARAASEWSELQKPADAVAANLLFAWLAQWDVELYKRFFLRLEHRSIFSLLLPTCNLERARAQPRSRGNMRFPITRLIDLVYAMGAFHQGQVWPKARPTLRDLVRATAQPEANLVNWRDGTKRMRFADFERIWESCFPKGEAERMPPIVPHYIAAALFQVLFVKVDTNSRHKEILLHDDHYLFWWNEQWKQNQQADKIPTGLIPWPAWLDAV